MYFNVCASLECGQVFRWFKSDNSYFLIAKDTVFRVEQEGKEAVNETSSEFSDDEILSYFSLNHNLDKIYKEIDNDKYIHDAICRFKGLRIFEQDLWESLLSYICATNTNIPRIHTMLNNLSEKFGNKIFFKNKKFYTYPSAKALAEASLFDLQKCGLGYRASYLSHTAKQIHFGEFDLNSLKKLNHAEAREELIKLMGVGYKVADCISLFGLQNFESFPVDVWASRFMKQYYDVDKKDIQQFTRDYFGSYAGYAQEYLFYKNRLES